MPVVLTSCDLAKHIYLLLVFFGGEGQVPTGFPVYRIMLSVNKDNFTSFFPVRMRLIFFVALVHWLDTPVQH